MKKMSNFAIAIQIKTLPLKSCNGYHGVNDHEEVYAANPNV